MSTVHYYIDEAGGIRTDSGFFILGAFKTDTPEELRSAALELRESIANSVYFYPFRDGLLNEGFHATANHPDIRARFYELLSTLNIRAYILTLKKDSIFFKQLIKDGLTHEDIYNRCIKKLLSDRLTKTRYDHNIIVFEQYGNKPVKWLQNVRGVILQTVNSINKKYRTKLSFEVRVHDKSDINLAYIDYINYLFVQFFEKENVTNRMRSNFNIIEPKIALVYKMDQDLYFHKNNRIDIDNY